MFGHKKCLHRRCKLAARIFELFMLDAAKMGIIFGMARGKGSFLHMKSVSLAKNVCFRTYPPENFAILQSSLYICNKIKRVDMRISNKLILVDFVQKHSQAVKPLNKWVDEVSAASWQSHNELKATFPSADYVGNGRYVFNIGGNKYRIIAVVLFINGVFELRFVGTHDEYDRIKDCSEV